MTLGVLVAISIPIFSSQLEKARDAVTLSNVRAAYAEAQSAYLTQSVEGTTVKYTAGTNGGATVTVSGVGAKGNKAGIDDAGNLPFDSSDVVSKMGGDAGSYTLTFTYTVDGLSTVTAEKK